MKNVASLSELGKYTNHNLNMAFQIQLYQNYNWISPFWNIEPKIFALDSRNFGRLPSGSFIFGGMKFIQNGSWLDFHLQCLS